MSNIMFYFFSFSSLADYYAFLLGIFIRYFYSDHLTRSSIRHFYWAFLLGIFIQTIFTKAFLLGILVRYFLCCFWILLVFCILFFENWFHTLLNEYWCNKLIRSIVVGNVNLFLLCSFFLECSHFCLDITRITV